MKLKHILLFSVSIVFTSCALKPISSDYTFIKTDLETVTLDQLGNGTILIYNGADILHKVDNTARLNIWIDETPLGQLKPREYVIIDLKNGKHQFKALHLDMVNMRSEHDVEINDTTKVIKIKPNISSNRLTVTNELPKTFEKFNYAGKR